MYLFLVAPIAPGLPLDFLSYYSKEEISLGSLVFITIRKRKVPGIIISAQKVEDEKMAIKNAPYAIKKIMKKEIHNFIEESLMKSIVEYGEKSLLSIPELLSHLFPERLLTKKQEDVNQATIFANKKERGVEVSLLGLPKEDRIARYKSLIRESFAKKETVVIFFPTIVELQSVEKELSKGIEEYSLCIHSKLTQKEWSLVDEKLESKHPLVILSTPSLYSFQRNDIGMIIIENEISHHYINLTGIDSRTLFTQIAKDSSLPLLFGSTLLSLERFNLYKEGRAVELSPLYLRGGDSFEIIKMDEEKRSGSPYLCIESLRELEIMKERNSGHYFIYTQRKGMYPTTICADCSTLLSCKNCDKPLVLHTIGATRAYMCHYCENLIQVTEENAVHCSNCGGWRMRMLGIASSGIEALLSKSGVPIFVIDGERTRTKKELLAVYDAWKREPFALLIGTELALNVLEECDGATIASLDSLFSLPEYAIDERIVALLLDLKQKTKGKVYLQTRMSKNPLFSYISDYSFLKYYEWALAERASLHLPPFYVVIKCVFTSLQEEERSYITKTLSEDKNEHAWFEAGGQRVLLFIHIKKEIWENESELRKKIASLCSNATLEYNPQSFFS